MSKWWVNFKRDYFCQVCRKAKVFLDSINIEPIIDVKTFNAALFEFAPDLVRHLKGHLGYLGFFWNVPSYNFNMFDYFARYASLVPIIIFCRHKIIHPFPSFAVDS